MYKKQKLFVRIVCIVLCVMMVVGAFTALLYSVL